MFANANNPFFENSSVAFYSGGQTFGGLFSFTSGSLTSDISLSGYVHAAGLNVQMTFQMLPVCCLLCEQPALLN